MSKPQIILNAGGAAIAMAIAYRLTNRMIDSVLPKKKGEEEEPADEPALDLLELCVNGDADAARLLLDNGAGPRVPPLLPSSWAARCLMYGRSIYKRWPWQWPRIPHSG